MKTYNYNPHATTKLLTSQGIIHLLTPRQLHKALRYPCSIKTDGTISNTQVIIKSK